MFCVPALPPPTLSRDCAPTAPPPKGRSSGSGLASKLKGAAGKVSGALDKDKVMPLMKFLVIAILGGLLLYLTGVALSQAFEAGARLPRPARAANLPLDGLTAATGSWHPAWQQAGGRRPC